MKVYSATGAFSPQVIEQILEAQKAPVKQLENTISTEREKLKLIDDLSQSLRKLPSYQQQLLARKNFKDLKLIAGDNTQITGTVDPDVAETGQWKLELLQLPQKAGVKSVGLPDKNKTLVGAGYFRFDTPQGPKEVYISRENSTLEGIAKTINEANIGIKALVVEHNTAKGERYHLMLTGEKPGLDRWVKFPQVYLIDGEQDFYFQEKVPAQNGKIKLDSMIVEVQDTIVKDLIPGVTLDIRQLKPGTEMVLRVQEDIDKITEKMKNFVNNLNEALNWTQKQETLTEDSKGQKRLGPYGAEFLTRNVQNRLRQMLFMPQNQGTIQLANQLGIVFNRDGTVDFDEGRFRKLLQDDPKEVFRFLKGDGFARGFFPTVQKTVTDLLNPTYGSLGARKKSMQDRINQLEQRKEATTARVEKQQQAIARQFAQAEAAIARFQAQSANLQQNLNTPIIPNLSIKS